MLSAEPEPYCIRAKLQTRPTAQTATRINNEMGPKIPKADSRAFLEGRRLASVFQMLQRVLKKKRERRKRRVTRRGRTMTSKASQTTMMRMARPAAKAAGDVSMSEIVPV